MEVAATGQVSVRAAALRNTADDKVLLADEFEFD